MQECYAVCCACFGDITITCGGKHEYHFLVQTCTQELQLEKGPKIRTKKHDKKEDGQDIVRMNSLTAILYNLL
jgi:hypothetical protein